MQTKEERINQIMACLNCTRKQAEQVFADDLAIDEELGSLSYEAPIADIKDIVKTIAAPVANDTNRRKPRKVEDEIMIIFNQIIEVLQENPEFEVKIKTEGREIALQSAENDYTVKIIRHRKPKAQ